MVSPNRITAEDCQANPQLLVPTLGKAVHLLNDFHHVLIGYAYEEQPWQNPNRREKFRREHCQPYGAVTPEEIRERNTPKRCLASNAEFFADVQRAVAEAGFNFRELQQQTRSLFEGTYVFRTKAEKPSVIQEWLRKKVLVYQHLRAMGYSHVDLTQ